MAREPPTALSSNPAEGKSGQYLTVGKLSMSSQNSRFSELANRYPRAREVEHCGLAEDVPSVGWRSRFFGDNRYRTTWHSTYLSTRVTIRIKGVAAAEDSTA